MEPAIYPVELQQLRFKRLRENFWWLKKNVLVPAGEYTFATLMFLPNVILGTGYWVRDRYPKNKKYGKFGRPDLYQLMCLYWLAAWYFPTLYVGDWFRRRKT